LDRLADADLLYVEGAPPQASYRFKHALIQDAAYDSLLKSRRQALHRRAAEILRDDPERAATAPEVIAHHFTQAGLDDLGIEWWGKAGDQALRRSAFQEAISHLGKAIAMADKMTSVSLGREEAAEAVGAQIRTKYAQALMITEGYTSEATHSAYSRIGVESDHRPRLVAERWPVLYGLWTKSIIGGDLPAALAAAETQLREGEEARLPAMVATAHRQISPTLFALGRFAEARRHAERARALYDTSWASEVLAITGSDFLAVAESYLANANWATGNVDGAKRGLKTALERAQATDRGWTLVFVLSAGLHFLGLARQHEEILKLTDAATATAADKGIGAWEPVVGLYRSWAKGWLGDPAIGIAQVRAAGDVLKERGMRLYDPVALAFLADLQAASGAADEALATIAQALRICGETGINFVLSGLHTSRGRALLASEPASAEAAYQEAIAVARAQGGRTLELSAALALARLLITNNRPLEAYAVLAPALEGFSPTLEMPEIAEAEALCATLADTEEVKADTAQRRRMTHLH